MPASCVKRTSRRRIRASQETVKLKRRGDLRRFWLGAASIRRKTKKCRACCGMADMCSRVNSTEELATIVDQPIRVA